jgi:hypothetical protein
MVFLVTGVACHSWYAGCGEHTGVEYEVVAHVDDGGRGLWFTPGGGDPAE